MKKAIRIASGAALITALMASASYAGGFSRGGVNIDLLFSEKKADFEAGVTFVAPQRTVDSATRIFNLATLSGIPGQTPVSSTNIDNSVGFFVPRVAGKIGLTDNLDCLGTFGTPFGADLENGLNNALSSSSVDFSIDTRDYGLTCSVKFDGGWTPLGKGQVRLIGGGSYLETEGFLSRQSLIDFTGLTGFSPALTGANTEGVGLFNIEDQSFGWRVGAAYEIPSIKALVSVVYSSAYTLNLTGTVNITAFNTPAALLSGGPVPIFLDETEFPQQLDIKIQSGIAPGTLAFLNFNWTDWSVLQSIPVNGVPDPITPGATAATFFEPLYRDGYTVTAGLGREFNENISGRLALTWDRGTSTTIGSQSDTWTLSSGIRITPHENKNLSLQVGGAVGILTSGSTSGIGQISLSTPSAQTFGTDFIGAANVTGKLKF